MGRNEDIQYAKERIRETERYLENLSDSEYAALHVDHQIKELEYRIKSDTKQLEELKAQAENINHGVVPKPPTNMDIWTDNFNRTSWRWLGRRDKQEEAYALPKGLLTDGGW